MRQTSYSFTKEAVINQLKEIYAIVIADNAKDYLDGDLTTVKLFNGLFGFGSQFSSEHIAERWAELCSEKFFQDNPDVQDVLMITEPETENMPVQKIWMASVS